LKAYSSRGRAVVVRRFSLPLLAVLGLAAGAAVPAVGEDAGIYAFIHSQRPERAVAPARPMPEIALPRFDVQAPRARLPRPRAVSRPRQERQEREEREEAGKPVMPVAARPIGEVSNPVPALLADKTLRAGDIVVFPDGPRVFKGQPGGRHALADFVKIASAKGLPQPARKIVSAMLIGRNDAWSMEELRPDRRLAARARDIDATGSTGKGRRSRR
jgi:hypothetical protein